MLNGISHTDAKGIDPAPDLEIALRFVAALRGSEDAQMTFQTFSDAGHSGLDPVASIFHGTVHEHWPRVVELQARGAGVFIAVNRTDGQGRKRANIVESCAIWADIDKPTSTNTPPIDPHIVVESSLGKQHKYWRTTAPSEEAHDAVMNRLALDHDADKSATDFARVLRLPGTVHQKDPTRPHLVTLSHVSSREPYTWAEIEAAFPPIESTEKALHESMEIVPLVATLQAGTEGMHDAAVRIAAHCAARRVDQGLTLAALRALISDGAGAERWRAANRDGELVRAVSSAYEKFHGFEDLATGKQLDPVDMFSTGAQHLEFTPSDFPPLITSLAIDTARRMGCDPIIPAFTAIVACAALTPDRFKVRVKAHDKTWRESPRLWVAFVGDPSSKKSPAMASILAPVYALQALLAREHKDREEAWTVQAARAKEAKAPAPPQPKSQRVLAGDTTTEALVNILEVNEEGLLVAYDELTAFFGSMDVYRPTGASKDKPFYLQSFNGGAYTVDRVGKGERFIANLSLCMLGGIQPDPMRRIAAKLDDDGLLQRFICLPVAPARQGDDIGADEESAERWRALVNELFSSRTDYFSSWPTEYFFAPEAQREIDEARRRIHGMGISPGTDKRLASALGKGDGQLARLTLVFHVITDRSERDLFTGRDAPSAEISVEVARMAVRVFFGLILPSLHKFYAEVIGLSPTHEHARWIAGLILSRGMSTITERDIYRAYHDLRDDGRRNIAPAMAQLELAAWVSPVNEKRGVVTEWRVNPEVHRKFAERAISERVRRERERAEICRNVEGSL